MVISQPFTHSACTALATPWHGLVTVWGYPVHLLSVNKVNHTMFEVKLGG